jgi:hypothetical protein
MFIGLILLIILLLLIAGNNYKEHFIDPYSLCLHDDITKKEEIWNKIHKKLHTY